MNEDARRKMIIAMEYIARQINNEDIVYELWLSEGVPDGDIPYGSFDIAKVEGYLLRDETFKDLMTCFLKCMKHAWNDGGLCCDNIVSNDKND